MEVIKTEQTHSGQYKRYGDSFYEWNITVKAGATKEEVLAYCQEHFGKRRSKEEWSELSVGQYNPEVYFGGYYELSGPTKFEDGIDMYHYTLCSPYTD